jgi:DNA mismatch endonuclease (patch repair protein)
MRAVKSEKTGPELALRRAMWRRNLRGYRTAVKGIRGAPDIAYPGKRIAIFIDGCYWHGCPQHCRRPSSNQSYWFAKIDRNMARDAATTDALRAEGWTVLRIWEHEVREDVGAVIDRIAAALTGATMPASLSHHHAPLRLVAEERAAYDAGP